MSANIFRYRNIEHEMRCVHAIRERKKLEAMAQIVPLKITHREQEMAA